MGVNYGQRRQRMSDMRNPGDLVQSSIGEKDFDQSHHDDELVYDDINRKLDAKEAKLLEKSAKFER